MRNTVALNLWMSKLHAHPLNQVYPCLCLHLSLKSWPCWRAEILPVFGYVVSSTQFCFGSQNHTIYSQNICVTQAPGKIFPMFVNIHAPAQAWRLKQADEEGPLAYCYMHPAGTKKQEDGPEVEACWAEVWMHRCTHLSLGWPSLDTGAAQSSSFDSWLLLLVTLA